MYYSYCINMNDVTITHDFEKMHVNAIVREHEQSKFDFWIKYRSATLSQKTRESIVVVPLLFLLDRLPGASPLASSRQICEFCNPN